jgi:hypothetical protein
MISLLAGLSNLEGLGTAGGVQALELARPRMVEELAMLGSSRHTKYCATLSTGIQQPLWAFSTFLPPLASDGCNGPPQPNTRPASMSVQIAEIQEMFFDHLEIARSISFLMTQ